MDDIENCYSVTSLYLFLLFFMSKWHSNPFTEGGLYKFIPIGAIVDDSENCYSVTSLYLFLLFFRSKWHSNPFTRGSYTFIPVGATVDDIENLAEPLPLDSPKVSCTLSHRLAA